VASDSFLDRPACTAADAPACVPDKPGVYAIFVSDARVLPKPFSTILGQQSTDLVYIGKAGGSLHRRLIKQDLEHRRAASFFRGLGAVLGYRPQQGSLFECVNKYNYRFSPSDEDEIRSWIRRHLGVNWDAAIPPVDKELIGLHRPILNITDNPEPVPELLELRAECRRIAAMPPARGGIRAT